MSKGKANIPLQNAYLHQLEEPGNMYLHQILELGLIPELIE